MDTGKSGAREEELPVQQAQLRLKPNKRRGSKTSSEAV
jgi:hypothetical protein